MTDETSTSINLPQACSRDITISHYQIYTSLCGVKVLQLAQCKNARVLGLKIANFRSF